MEMDERELRALLKSGPGDPRDRGCPDELTLATYWDGGLSPDRRTEFEAHLATCAGCFSQIGALARLERAAPEPVPGALLEAAKISTQPERRRTGTGSLAALAAGLVAVLGLLFWLPTRLDGPPELRAPAVAASTPEVLHPRDGGLLYDNESIRWRPVDRALFYRVRLTTDFGDPVWEGEASESELRAPAGLGLVPGELYFVWVRAHRDDGKTIKSKAVGFRVAPPGER